MMETLKDPTVIVAAVAFIAAILSLAGTIYMANTGVKNAQLHASDKIAIGSVELLDEYRLERRIDRREIENLRNEMAEFRKWKREVTGFIIPFIEGSKANERQLIEADLIPVYKLPPFPKWLTNGH
jgi:hypothetical protein